MRVLAWPRTLWRHFSCGHARRVLPPCSDVRAATGECSAESLPTSSAIPVVWRCLSASRRVATRIRDASPPPPPLVRSFTFLSHFANISDDVAIVGGGNAGAGDSPRRLVPPAAAAARGTTADAIAKIAAALPRAQCLRRSRTSATARRSWTRPFATRSMPPGLRTREENGARRRR